MATSGNVTDEAWGRYIEEQKPPEPDDDFKKVVQSAAWPIDPASSRNPKPPPVRRWRIHLVFMSVSETVGGAYVDLQHCILD